MVGPGYGAGRSGGGGGTVRAAAEALKDIGIYVEPGEHPGAATRFRSPTCLNKLHMMEMKPAFAEATAGHESEMFKMSKDDAVRSPTRR